MNSLAVSSYNREKPFRTLDNTLLSDSDRSRPYKVLPSKTGLEEGASFGKENDDAVTIGERDLLRAYVYFLASLSEDVKDGSVEFSDKVEEIARRLQTPGSRSPSPASQGASFEFEGELSYEKQTTLAMVSSGDSFAMSASSSFELHAAFEAEFTNADGSVLEISADIDISIDIQIQAFVAQGATQQGEVKKSDPLALDLDRDGQFALTDYSNGALFDIDGDGNIDQTAFVTGNDVFLALDRNNNGTVDNGLELFGDQHGAANGFLELASFDDDKNGIIDKNDSVYERLLGVKLTADGRLEQALLSSLGVEQIFLDYTNRNETIAGGNTLAQLGRYTATDGSTQSAGDVLLNYRSPV